MMIKNENWSAVENVIKSMYCKNLNDSEIAVFSHVCKKTGLDPAVRQIYAIKRGNQMTIQTGIDGLRLIAERTGNYSPGREPTFIYDEKGKMIAATSYIKKRTSDNVWHEVGCTAYLEEYDTKQGLWNKMPRTMISKCAESLALRKAFPAELSGLYSDEEMDQAKGTIDLKDIPLEESQCAMLDMLILEINDCEKHKQKVKDWLGVDSIYEAKQKDFKRIEEYFEKVLSIQRAKLLEVQDESATVA